MSETEEQKNAMARFTEVVGKLPTADDVKEAFGALADLFVAYGLPSEKRDERKD